jgi:hypothetical protein
MARNTSCLNLAAASVQYSQSPKVLAEVERALAENPRPEYADALYKLFERNPNRLGDAAAGLVWLRDKRVLPRLKKFADFERHPKLALSASHALGRFGSAEARPILENSLSYCKRLLSEGLRGDSSLKVKAMIIERSLAMIDLYESKDRLNRLIEWIDSHRDATITWAMVSIVRNSDDTTVHKIRKRIAELEQPRHRFVIRRLIDVLAALEAPLSASEAKIAEASYIRYLARGLRPSGARPE